MFLICVTKVGRGTRGHVLASCVVELRSEDRKDVITVMDARILKNKKTGKLFVAYPTQSIKDRTGTLKYIEIIELSRDLKQRISDKVLDEYANIAGAKIQTENYE